MRSFWALLVSGLACSLISVVAVLSLQSWQAFQAAKVSPQAPGTAYIDAYKCGRGLNKIVLMGGVEDNFGLLNEEPARINPARLPNPYLQSIASAHDGMLTLRDYDEGGQDKLFIDYFEVPRGILSGQMVMVQKPLGSQTYDTLKFGDFGNARPVQNGDAYTTVAALNYSFGFDLANFVQNDKESGLLVIDLNSAAFTNDKTPPTLSPQRETVIDYLNTPARPDTLDVQIQDDTAVDFVALVLCQTPQITKGTSFVEYDGKPAGQQVSNLSCQDDKTQAPCNPFQGDQLCTLALPLACYKQSKSPAPVIENILTLNSGEVRPSRPVIGAQFPDLASADKVCVEQFGQGWRVLAYHDGQSGGIRTLSKIAPKTRLWIDVRDQQYGNCWDREKPRLKQ